MDDRVAHDVCNLVVSQRIGDLAAAPLGRHESGRAQYPEVLRYEGLTRAEGLDELVHAAGAVGELLDDGQADRCGKHPQQLASFFQPGRSTRRHKLGRTHPNTLTNVHVFMAFARALPLRRVHWVACGECPYSSAVPSPPTT